MNLTDIFKKKADAATDINSKSALIENENMALNDDDLSVVAGAGEPIPIPKVEDKDR